MLTQMEVFTPGITDPPIPIVDQNVAKDPFQIKKIDGLGPVTASVNTTQYGSVDGEFLNGVHTPKRNIVLTLGLNPDWKIQTIESLRQILYSYFMPENQVRLRFTSTHMETVEIIGYVESCEPDHFSKDPEFQISILCPQPYFTAVQATALQGTTQELAAPTDVLVNYQGNVETGFILDATIPSGASSYLGEFRLLNKTPTNSLMILSSVTVSTTQFFELNTVQGNKYARQVPLAGQYTNILGRVSPGSTWPTLRKGINKIQVLTNAPGVTKVLDWTISYYARYGGL